MKWYVKIDGYKDLMLCVKFEPLDEIIIVEGQAKVSGNNWVVFSEETHDMKITLEELTTLMESVVNKMQRRVGEYVNLKNGFSVLKTIAILDDDGVEQNNED